MVLAADTDPDKKFWPLDKPKLARSSQKKPVFTKPNQKTR
jgi:hypothetical protein